MPNLLIHASSILFFRSKLVFLVIVNSSCDAPCFSLNCVFVWNFNRSVLLLVVICNVQDYSLNELNILVGILYLS